MHKLFFKSALPALALLLANGPPEPDINSAYSTVNLSTHNLTEPDLKLLEKGLSFIPSNKCLPISNVIQNQNKLLRSIKINSLVRKCPDFTTSSKTPNQNSTKIKRNFTEKSTWVPENFRLNEKVLKLLDEIKLCTAECIESFTKRNNAKVPDKLFEKNPNNLSSEERYSLKSLKENHDIVIKEADKGSAVVIMNRKDYIEEGQRQLSDGKYYKKLEKPIFTANIPKIEKILTEMHQQKFISKAQLSYLTGPKNIRQRVFYLLPKIHKKPETWPKPGIMPPGRPIVSDTESETYRISEFIDFYLNPLSIKHKSYIKNSYEFVQKIKNFATDSNYLLVTGDVESLYTNMNLDRSLKCTKEILKCHPDPSRSDKHLLQLLEICLKNNDFTFNNKFYLQTMGCAMGKRFAPSLANIYLLDFDTKAMNGYKTKPLIFFRYLDDIFLLWPGDVASLIEYEKYLNSLIPDINIKLEYSHEKISFLDVLVYIEEGKLKTKTFFKETDKHLLLHTGSFHPKHVFEGLVKSQLLRFKRLSSTRDNYNQSSKILFKVLSNRGYNQSKLRHMQHEIWFQQESNREKTPNILPIITDHGEFGNLISNKYKNLIANSNCFSNYKIVKAHKTGKTLKNILVRSNIVNNENNPRHGYRTCGKLNCFTCKYHATDSKTFSSSKNNKIFNIRDSIYCNSTNIIYLITCTKCQTQYVGETERSLRDRMTDHRSKVKNKQNTPIGIHFNLPGHSILNIKINPIEIVKSNNKATRLTREKFWQEKLETCYPSGINNLPIV